MMNLQQADLNLLKVAASLYRHRNASRAGQELGLSQSAVSHALARLRGHFGDPLFVRGAKGLVLTEFARGIEPEVLALTERFAELVSRKAAFDPARAQARITLATHDFFEVVAMPKLIARLDREAPGLQLSVRPTGGELPKRELEDGRVDYAVAGFYDRLPEGYFQAKLFTSEFACAARKVVRGDAWFDASHALITLQGDFEDEVLHKVGKKKRVRRIRYGTYSFTSLAWLLAETDLVVTAPQRLLERYAERFPLKLWEPPIPIDPIEMMLVWHLRTQHDPLHAWFRARLREACA